MLISNHICGIPLSNYGAVDKLVWQHTKNGFFTVNLTYHLKCRQLRRRQDEFSNREANDVLWKSL